MTEEEPSWSWMYRGNLRGPPCKLEQRLSGERRLGFLMLSAVAVDTPS